MKSSQPEAMAALVLRRAVSSSSPISRSAGNSSSLAARSPSLSVSTFAATDHPALVNSALEKSATFPPFRVDPRTPILDGFSFTVINNMSTLTLLRQDKDEKIEVDVVLPRYHLVDGNPCFLIDASITRGYWELQLEFFAGDKTLIISSAELSNSRERDLPCFKDLLKSRGINKELLTSLSSIWTD